jgi:hypothetical protein
MKTKSVARLLKDSGMEISHIDFTPDCDVEDDCIWIKNGHSLVGIGIQVNSSYFCVFVENVDETFTFYPYHDNRILSIKSLVNDIHSAMER